MMVKLCILEQQICKKDHLFLSEYEKNIQVIYFMRCFELISQFYGDQRFSVRSYNILRLLFFSHLDLTATAKTTRTSVQVTPIYLCVYI